MMKNVIVSGPFGNVTENVNALYNYDACNITSVTIITYLVNIILIECYCYSKGMEGQLYYKSF